MIYINITIIEYVVISVIYSSVFFPLVTSNFRF